MSRKNSLLRLIGFGIWLALVAFALVFLLRWRGRVTSQPTDHPVRPSANAIGGDGAA
jgi:hypothetical protein